MKLKQTHTYAVLQISDAAFAEIKTALENAGYADQFHKDNGQVVIDMHGIALADQKWTPYSISGPLQ